MGLNDTKETMKFNVIAIGVDLTATPYLYTDPRVETIDTGTDELFAQCVSIRDVEVAYEALWNYGNGPDAVRDPSEKVKVLSVVRIKR
jgi:hypothetical protein